MLAKSGKAVLNKHANNNGYARLKVDDNENLSITFANFSGDWTLNALHRDNTSRFFDRDTFTGYEYKTMVNNNEKETNASGQLIDKVQKTEFSAYMKETFNGNDGCLLTVKIQDGNEEKYYLLVHRARFRIQVSEGKGTTMSLP